MNILITGANGFIGRALCDKLLADGYHVRGAVRRAAQMTALLSGVEGAMVGDIGPETDWSEALDGIERIVHLAARVHVMRESAADPLAAFRLVNVAGTERLARQAAEAGVKRFVFISSIKVNGERTGGRDQRSEIRSREKTEVAGHPSEIEKKKAFHRVKRSEVDPQITQITRVRKRGTGDGGGRSEIRSQKSEIRNREKTEVRGQGGEPKEVFSEGDVPDPRDPYAVSKWEAEQGLLAIVEETGLEVVIIRPPLVYGPGVKANFRSLMKWVQRGVPLPLGAVYNKRSFVALDNLVSFIIHCIDHPKAANEVFLISDDEDISITELLQKMARAFGKRSFLLPVPVGLMTFVAGLLGKRDVADRLFGSLQVDSSKARDLLGWKPVVSMNEALRKTAEGYFGE